jgi:hypothetical protein
VEVKDVGKGKNLNEQSVGVMEFELRKAECTSTFQW